MVWVLVCIGILILLTVYGFFPSSELFFVLLLLALLFTIYTIEVFRVCCCGTTEIENLEPDIKPQKLKDTPSKAALKTHWGKLGGCRTKQSKKESFKKEVLTGCESGSKGFAGQEENGKRASSDTSEVSSDAPLKYLTSEATIEKYPKVVSDGPPICVFVEDNYDGCGEIARAEAMDESGGNEVLDEVIEVVVEERQLPKALRDLGPVLNHKRGDRFRAPHGCLTTHV